MKIALTLILAAAILAVSPVYSAPFSERKIPVTRDLDSNPLPTRAEYIRHFPVNPLVIHTVNRPEFWRDNEVVAVVINHDHYNALEEQFDNWIAGIEEDGFETVLLIVEGGEPGELKELIVEEAGEDLAGMIMAGELPLAWYEHFEYFQDENQPDNNRLIEYPIDLFWMDIDGEWADTSGNGVYDHHHGAVDPDIWLGRIPAYNLSRIDENEIVGDYLDKVSRYREGDLTVPHRSVNFIDDDWARLAGKWTSDIHNLYGDIFVEADPESTRVSNYIGVLESEGYELLQVAVHSSSDAHNFYINNREDREYFRFWDLRDEVLSNAMFYNLFACSAMNFAPRENQPRNLCLGVLYALGGESSLGAVGSTKTGGMLRFDDFYRPLSEGASFGEALRLWLVDNAHDPESPNWARSWFYGMTYYGDPTLKIRQGLRVTGMITWDPEGDEDNFADAGETINLIGILHNRSAESFENITLRLRKRPRYNLLIRMRTGRSEGFQ